MATFLSPDHMTLSEALELQRWNGDYSMLRGMERKSNIMRILPWEETSDGDFHKGAKVTQLPKGKFGAINKPLPTGQAATTEYTERVGIFELKSDVDERILKGKSVEQAFEILQFCERAVAVDIEKVLRSAVANAENNNGMRGSDLVVARCYADDGPTLKRIRPRAKGSASQILKRTSHITVVVAPGKEA